MENSITREEERLAGRDEGGDLAGSLEQSLREDTVGGGRDENKESKSHSPALLFQGEEWKCPGNTWQS